MTIEELKHLRDIVGCKLPIINDEDRNKLNLLIDAEIARQSVTDEDVQRAKNWIEEYYKFWHHLSTQPELEVFETILTALQQMQKSQELEKENQGLKKVIEDMQRNLDAWNPRQSLNEPMFTNQSPHKIQTTTNSKSGDYWSASSNYLKI